MTRIAPYPGLKDATAPSSAGRTRNYMGQILTHQRFSGPGTQGDPWLTKQQVASHLQVTCRTVDRWTQAGLPYQKLGHRRRYKIQAVEAWLAETSQTP